jgi:hypothetical protein
MLGVVALIAIGSLAVTVTDVHFPGRALLAVAFAATVPGIPIVATFRIPSREVQFVLGVALSLALGLLTSFVELETGAWSPIAAQVMLTALGLTASMLALIGRVHE